MYVKLITGHGSFQHRLEPPSMVWVGHQGNTDAPLRIDQFLTRFEPPDRTPCILLRSVVDHLSSVCNPPARSIATDGGRLSIRDSPATIGWNRNKGRAKGISPFYVPTLNAFYNIFLTRFGESRKIRKGRKTGLSSSRLDQSIGSDLGAPLPMTWSRPVSRTLLTDYSRIYPSPTRTSPLSIGLSVGTPSRQQSRVSLQRRLRLRG